jgi:hypothetical protein
MLAAVDRYDAFALMVGLTEITNNLRGVLIRYEKFRKEWLAAQGGGSLIGLAMSLALTALPIFAHHGMLGQGPLAYQLVQTPNVLFKIQQQLKDGEANLTKIMQEQAAEMTKQRQQAKTPPQNTPNGHQAAR